MIQLDALPVAEALEVLYFEVVKQSHAVSSSCTTAPPTSISAVTDAVISAARYSCRRSMAVSILVTSLV